MVFKYNKLKFIIALFVIFGIAVSDAVQKDSTEIKKTPRKKKLQKTKLKKKISRKMKLLQVQATSCTSAKNTKTVKKSVFLMYLQFQAAADI